MPVVSIARLKEIDLNRVERERKKYQHLISKENQRAAQEGRARGRLLRIKNLTDKHLMAIDLLADLVHNWPMEYIANQCEISLSKLKRWRNDPVFLARLDKEITKRRTLVRLEAFRHLFKAIRRGDKRMIREYFKMTGDLKEQIEMEFTEVDRMSDQQLETEIKKMEDELGINISR